MTNKNPHTNDVPVLLPTGRYQSVAGYARDQKISRVAVLGRINRGVVTAHRVGIAWIIELK